MIGPLFAPLLAAGLAWGTRLEVATYNTWGLPPPLARSSRGSRLPRIASWIDEHSFDLVGLSEVWGGSRALLPLSGLLAASRQRGDTGLAVRTRLPAGTPHTLHYRDARGFDRLKKKGALIVPVSLPEGALTMVVTHLQASAGSAAAEVRSWQVAELLAALDGVTDPVVLTGDFNFYAAQAADRASVAAIQGAGFLDTLDGSDAPTHQLEAERFDRIYVRDGRGGRRLRVVVEESAVLDGVVAAWSDHLPVRARLRVLTPEDAPPTETTASPDRVRRTPDNDTLRWRPKESSTRHARR